MRKHFDYLPPEGFVHAHKRFGLKRPNYVQTRGLITIITRLEQYGIYNGVVSKWRCNLIQLSFYKPSIPEKE